MLSVVIPTLNAASDLAQTIAALTPGRASGVIEEIVVVDGASRDDSAVLAAQAGAQVITSPPGRGGQLRLGAGAARSDWLLFLHADTRPDPGTWRDPQFLGILAAAGGRPVERAWYFRLAFDDPGASASVIAFGANIRARALALPYGDQGLLIHRRLYDAVGGYRALPLMEDVDLVRRLGRNRLAALQLAATTSAARYRRQGYWRRVAGNAKLLAMYYAGVSPEELARRYG
jgi:rSAM/selenodomain-associated transferase 2